MEELNDRECARVSDILLKIFETTRIAELENAIAMAKFTAITEKDIEDVNEIGEAYREYCSGSLKSKCALISLYEKVKNNFLQKVG